ncbi:PilN domain-containing protein [Methylomarinum sp. Ch1-1]|uniref:PilN domain-containing protein n=1 Tax=Methylomarinum roseum TaxID=3067653 RepID=A0AAU7NVN7_9GAMM|nr:PilN domain-containing protein [Methylomarinum sp. Ch1-1]MDP4522962.1 PilN domain-containing protein [Methylomarinum sp. Ch1-1]
MNLDSNIEFDIKRFFRWWGRELAMLMSEKLRHWLSDQSGYVFLSVEDDTLRLSALVEGERRAIAAVPLNDQTTAKYSQLKADNPDLEKARCILRLNARQAIGRILFLPAAAQENLNQVLVFEMDRYTPFTAEQVYFAAKLLGAEENGQIRVLLVATPKARLDSLYHELTNAGIHPSVADFAEAPNDFEQDWEPYNLLPPQFRPTSNRLTQSLTWTSAAIALLLMIAVLVFPVWHEGRIVADLRRQIKQLEKDTHIVQARQQEIDGIVNETERLINIKNSTPSLAELINTLSLLMPDDTWLTHLQYNNDKLQIQGQSPAASALIGVLEASPLFKNARFVSPLTQDRRTGLERFQISAEVQAAEESGDVE